MTSDKSRQISLSLNGETRTAAIDTRMLLVEALRESFDTTGPKIGCATGDCGVCTVILDGNPAKACLTLAIAANGAQVTTLEGIADEGELTTLQRAFWDDYAFQCGFCLSGMLFAGQDLLDRVPDPTDEEIRAAISGNLCRCTGYDNIVAAIRRAAADAGTDPQELGSATRPHVQDGPAQEARANSVLGHSSQSDLDI